MLSCHHLQYIAALFGLSLNHSSDSMSLFDLAAGTAVEGSIVKEAALLFSSSSY